MLDDLLHRQDEPKSHISRASNISARLFSRYMVEWQYAIENHLSDLVLIAQYSIFRMMAGFMQPCIPYFKSVAA